MSCDYPVDYALICRHGCGRIVTEDTFGPRMGGCCNAPRGDDRCLGLFYYATADELRHSEKSK